MRKHYAHSKLVIVRAHRIKLAVIKILLLKQRLKEDGELRAVSRVCPQRHWQEWESVFRSADGLRQGCVVNNAST
jgi:hypothetical protein